MNDLSPATLAQAPVASASAILVAAGLLLPSLERGQRIDSAALRMAMEAAFGASDASGLWDWKASYEACEAATVLFLRKYGRAIFRQDDTPAARLTALSKIAGLLPSHTRRSEESQALQQFSTPVPLGFAALTAAPNTIPSATPLARLPIATPMPAPSAMPTPTNPAAFFMTVSLCVALTIPRW